MAATRTYSNHWKYKLAQDADYSADVFKVILMNSAFAFDKDTHATLADVTASQLTTSNGYTQNSKTLANVAITESDANDQAEVTWDDPVWTSTGDYLGGGATGSACIYDDTTSDDTIVMCIDYGADYSVANGTNFSLGDIQNNLT